MSKAVDMEFQEKVVMITGAASGIGAATALEFARHGASLSLADLNDGGLNDTIRRCQSVAPHSLMVSKTPGNLCHQACVQQFVNDTISSLGKIDILVNCAGICLQDNILNFDLDVFDKQMDVNIRVMYHLTALCTPHIIKAKGCIINVSSAAPKIVSIKELAYSMSKAAVDYFTKHVAAELGPHGVRVNSISPGVVLTNIHGQPRETEIIQHSNKHFANRCTEAEEIANVILFMASSKSAMMTGTDLLFDGGLTVKKQAY